jgi:uncharacterized membrane protein YagU involved in acid resistance
MVALVYIPSDPECMPLLFTTITLCLIFGVLSRKYPEKITILSTSLVGVIILLFIFRLIV